MKLQQLAAIALSCSIAPWLMAAPFAYLPSPETNQVHVHDLATDIPRSGTKDKLPLTLTVQSAPVAATPNRAGTFVYVVNNNSNSVTIVNSAVNQVAGTISTGSKPVAAVVTLDDKKLFVANSGDNTISVIDLDKQQTIGSITSAGTPSRLLITPGGKLYVWSSADNKIQAFDIATSKPLFSLDIGAPSVGIASITDKAIYAATQDGRVVYWNVEDITKISAPSTFSVVPNANGQTRAIKAISANESLNRLYLALADGAFVAIDGSDHSTTSQIQVATTLKSPSGIQIVPGTANVAITDAGGTALALIDTVDNKVAYKTIGSKIVANGNFISTPSFQMAEAVYSKEEDNNTYAYNTVTVTIKRTGNLSGLAKVSYLTESGTAFTKWDFAETKGDLEFADGEASKEVTIQIVGDLSIESDEYFTLRLNNPRDGHGTGPQESARIDIVNDDHDPKGCTVGSKGPADPTLPALLAAALMSLWLGRKRAPQ